MAASFLFLSCYDKIPEDIEITGKWSIGTVNITITNKSYTVDDSNSDFWNYGGEIVSYNNNSYNIPKENPDNGDFGHLILKIIHHTGDAKQIGTFTVIRWKELKTLNGVTTIEYSEAYPAKWNRAGEAFSSAKEQTNFTLYSSLTKK